MGGREPRGCGARGLARHVCKAAERAGELESWRGRLAESGLCRGAAVRGRAGMGGDVRDRRQAACLCQQVVYHCSQTGWSSGDGGQLLTQGLGVPALPNSYTMQISGCHRTTHSFARHMPSGLPQHTRRPQDPRVERLPCTHKGTYADDCICQRVQQHRCYIVATCDRDLRRRIRKVGREPARRRGLWTKEGGKREAWAVDRWRGPCRLGEAGRGRLGAEAEAALQLPWS